MRYHSAVTAPANHRVIHGFDVDTITTAPLQLSQYAYLHAGHQAVFDVVSDHASLHKYTLSIKRIEVLNINPDDDTVGVGTLRSCYTPAGLTLRERIVCWQPGLMYGYVIDNFPVILPNHLSLVLTEPTCNGHTLLTWQTYFAGRMIGGTFARTTLGIVLPDLVKNLVKHFSGHVLTKSQVHPHLDNIGDALAAENC